MAKRVRRETQTEKLKNEARIAHQAGLTIIPTREKRPIVASWGEFQHQLQTIEQVKSFNYGCADGLAVILGPTSRNIMAFDIDKAGPAVLAEILNRMKVSDSYTGVVQSPSKASFHIWFQMNKYDVHTARKMRVAASEIQPGARNHVEFLARGQYVNMPPTRLKLSYSRAYKWLNGRPDVRKLARLDIDAIAEILGQAPATEHNRENTTYEHNLPASFVAAIESRLQFITEKQTAKGWRACHCPNPEHRDENASAGYNASEGVVKCFACCEPGRVWLMKEVGAFFGLNLRDFYNASAISTEPVQQDMSHVIYTELATKLIQHLRHARAGRAVAILRTYEAGEVVTVKQVQADLNLSRKTAQQALNASIEGENVFTPVRSTDSQADKATQYRIPTRQHIETLTNHSGPQHWTLHHISTEELLRPATFKDAMLELPMRGRRGQATLSVAALSEQAKVSKRTAIRRIKRNDNIIKTAQYQYTPVDEHIWQSWPKEVRDMRDLLQVGPSACIVGSADGDETERRYPPNLYGAWQCYTEHQQVFIREQRANLYEVKTDEVED